MKILRFVRQLAKLFFVFLISCLFALGPASTVRASSSGFHVSGRFILDANGNNFIMRGMNVAYNWWPEQTISSFPDVKATGANTVRVVLSLGGQSGNKNSADDVANVISLCKANKLVCVLEVHDTMGYGQEPGASTLAEAAAYWIEIKSALVGQEAYVIINIGNEPYGEPAGIDRSLWIGDTENAIAQLRAAGLQHMLMVDGPDWGQDHEHVMMDNAASILNSDPLRNTVFSVHMYDMFDDPQKVEDYISAFVNANLPLIIGEFGPLDGNPGAIEDAIMATAQANGIGYLGWVWANQAEMDMVSNFDPNQETPWGNRFIHGPNGIASTSHEASIYGGSVNLDAVTTGVFRPSNGVIFLKNNNTTGFADVGLNYGIPGDYPVVGDWDGNRTATIGIYRNGSFYLRNSNTIGFADMVFPFGTPGDQPIAGDWNGDGVDTIGVYRPWTGQFLLRNSNSAGVAELSFYLGNVGDVGIAGDWDGNGTDTTGVFRPSNGILFLKNTNQTGFADVALNYGIPGDRPVTGDWDGDGTDTIGVYRNGQFMLRNSNTVGFADIVFGLGNPGDMPIAGNWDGLP